MSNWHIVGRQFIQNVSVIVSHRCQLLDQVTYMSHVEAFATGIKIDQRIKQGDLQNKRIKNTWLQFDLGTIKNQVMKSLRRE